MQKRFFLQSAALLAAAGVGANALPQAAPARGSIRFQLDWRFEGPSALFLLPLAKGYFRDAGLDVVVDVGNGSGGAVQRVASGAYDMGFADFPAVMEFHANNPEVPNKPVAVMMVYNSTPAAVIALKKSGITKPTDLSGKKLGAPVADAGRRAFPIFQQANRIGAVQWVSMDPPLRETMLLRGDVDAVTGFVFSVLPNLQARGAQASDLVVMPYADFGVQLYGNAIIATPQLIRQNPAAIKSFLQAFARGAREVIADPAGAIAHVKARDAVIHSERETARLQLLIRSVIDSPGARAEGFGQTRPERLALMAAQVSQAFQTRTAIKSADVWNAGFLPGARELDILPKP